MTITLSHHSFRNHYQPFQPPPQKKEAWFTYCFNRIWHCNLFWVFKYIWSTYINQHISTYYHMFIEFISSSNLNISGWDPPWQATSDSLRSSQPCCHVQQGSELRIEHLRLLFRTTPSRWIPPWLGPWTMRFIWVYVGGYHMIPLCLQY
jgi:hypothetical protein